MIWKSLIISIVAIVAFFLAISPSFAQEKNDLSGQPGISQEISIVDAVNIALENNPTIASRRALVSAAAARVEMTKAMTRPMVSTTTTGSISNMPMVMPGSPNIEPQNFSVTDDSARIEQSLMAMYPIFTGGNLKNRVNSAKAMQQVSNYDLSASELDTAQAVKNACYFVLLARKYVDAYQARVDQATERVRVSEESFEVGRIAKFDLLRNKTDLAEAEQALNNALRDVEIALADLKNLMGVSQSSKITLKESLTVQPAPPALEQLIAEAMQQRPESHAALARVKSAQANIEVAKSAYKPQVYATGMVSLSASDGNSMADDTDSGYLVGVTASLPIFDGGARKSAVDEAQAMTQQALSDQQEIIQGITKSVTIAYAQLNAATKNVGLSKDAILQAEEDYRAMRLRYEAGKATNVEVLDALASLTRAQTMFADALYQQNVAQQALNRAVGQM